ncbi:uncharacterized protein LOC143234350 [Tachypleus tridentatus]|uniref:uncharacterized protein LOC143234350 n=1 Tax=Tachypleus tridentatus TaxID=6853 RepID=UPI003FD22CC6
MEKIYERKDKLNHVMSKNILRDLYFFHLDGFSCINICCCVSIVVGIPSYLFALRRLETHNKEIKGKYVTGKRFPANERASLDVITTADSANEINSLESDDHELVEDCSAFKTSQGA